MKPLRAGHFPVSPKKFPAPAEKVPCAREENSLPRKTGNLLQVIGNVASTQSETAESVPIPKKSLPESLPPGNSSSPLMIGVGVEVLVERRVSVGRRFTHERVFDGLDKAEHLALRHRHRRRLGPQQRHALRIASASCSGSAHGLVFGLDDE